MPARGYSRERFRPGNTVSVRSGAWSERHVSAAAAELRVFLLETRPELAQDIFVPALDNFTRALGRMRLLDDYVEKKMDAAETLEEGVESIPQRVWEAVERAARNAQTFGSNCGLDAAGYSKVLRDLGLAESTRRQMVRGDAKQLGEEGRALREARGRGPEGHTQ